mmetsp:Transcript_22627/g.28987  ORF Transcript_22627/g.28987 Transcript_22627/m.28987 type:complete len:105 (-) Transcript_22627:150-464(-)
MNNLVFAYSGTYFYNSLSWCNETCANSCSRKTIGAECNYGVRFDGPYGIDNIMNGIVKEVEKRCLRICCRGKKLTLKIMKRQENAKELVLLWYYCYQDKSIKKY